MAALLVIRLIMKVLHSGHRSLVHCLLPMRHLLKISGVRKTVSHSPLPAAQLDLSAIPEFLRALLLTRALLLMRVPFLTSHLDPTFLLKAAVVHMNLRVLAKRVLL